MFRLCCLVLMISAVSGFQWLDTIQDHQTVVTCVGGDVILPFNFTLEQGQRVQDMTWIFQAADGRADEDIAIMARGHFLPMPVFSGRVQWMGEGGIVVSGATVLESGNYTVVVIVESTANSFVKYQRTAFVQVSEPPATTDGNLHVRQSGQAVKDAVTGQWSVLLTCGVLTKQGHLAVQDVIWTTPEGHHLASSREENGTFSLLIPNPPSGGNYTCSLRPLAPATSCLPHDSPLLGGASVVVDEVKAALSLLAAQQTDMKEQVDADLQAQKTQLQTQNTELLAQKTQLQTQETELQAQKAEINLLKSKNDNLTSSLSGVQAENDHLKHDLADIATKLNISTQNVYFTAYLSPDLNAYQGIIKPYTIIENVGNGFDNSAGVFQASLAGVYHFVGAATSFGNGNWVDMRLMKNGVAVSTAWASSPGNYAVMGTAHCTVHLAVGDRMWLHSVGTNTFYEHQSTAFTGVLIHADL